jgi:DNA-binding LacI/PurR family transcriptional regulator
MAMEMLLCLLSGAQDVQDITIEPTLVCRKSTAPARH